MQQVAELVKRNLETRKPSSDPNHRDFSTAERWLINYVFFRASNIYQNFGVSYPSDEHLATAKREWGGAICSRSKDDIDHGFDALKGRIGQDPRFTWFNPALLLSLCPSRHAAHQLYLDRPSKPVPKQEALKRLSAIRSILE